MDAVLARVLAIPNPQMPGLVPTRSTPNSTASPTFSEMNPSARVTLQHTDAAPPQKSDDTRRDLIQFPPLPGVQHSCTHGIVPTHEQVAMVNCSFQNLQGASAGKDFMMDSDATAMKNSGMIATYDPTAKNSVTGMDNGIVHAKDNPSMEPQTKSFVNVLAPSYVKQPPVRKGEFLSVNIDDAVHQSGV